MATKTENNAVEEVVEEKSTAKKAEAAPKKEKETVAESKASTKTAAKPAAKKETKEASADKKTEEKKPAEKKPAEKKPAEKKDNAKKAVAKKDDDKKETKSKADDKKEDRDSKEEKKKTSKKNVKKTGVVVRIEALKKKAEKAPKSGLKIRLVKGFSGRLNNQIATAQSLGLRRIGDVTFQPDNACTRGKLAKISHMVEVIEL